MVFSSWAGLRIQTWGRGFPLGEPDSALQLPGRGSGQEDYKGNPLFQEIPCRVERYSVLVRLLCPEYHLNLWLTHVLALDELEVSQQEENPQHANLISDSSLQYFHQLLPPYY